MIRIIAMERELRMFYKNMGFYLEGVPECEELVGVTHRG